MGDAVEVKKIGKTMGYINTLTKPFMVVYA